MPPGGGPSGLCFFQEVRRRRHQARRPPLAVVTEPSGTAESFLHALEESLPIFEKHREMIIQKLRQAVRVGLEGDELSTA
jgi:hypothetical protein